MIKSIARIVVRDTDDENDGLMIGVRFKSGKFFKKGHIYEVVENEILDTIEIKDLGPSAIKKDNNTVKGGLSGVNWHHTINDILDWTGKYLFLTEKEYDQIYNKELK